MSNITTLPVIEANAPGLLQNSIDERIVKVRPTSTPIDQLTRCAGTRTAHAMRVDYYTVDSRPITAKVSSQIDSCTYGDDQDYFEVELTTDNNAIFEPTETLLLPSVKVASGASGLLSPLMLYVIRRDKNSMTCAAINPPKKNGVYTIPTIPAKSEVVRMGRAAGELDVQTAQFAALPRKDFNYCQIFKMQVEQSTFAKIARKEVGWNFSDQEEAAIIDMRLGMEKNFLFGSRARVFDPDKKEEIYLTGGIWQQAEREASLSLNALTEDALTELCAQAFTGHNGSKKKILVAGTGLVTALTRLEHSKVLGAAETRAKWGVEFREFNSNFGKLWLVHSEVFDQCGHGDDGFIIDPDYLTKYVHLPFQADTLDLRSSGQRNTDAVVLTEASCLVLRYPKAHLRVIGK